MLYVWCAVLALSVGIEIFTRRLIAIWFLPAGTVSLVLSICTVSPLWQVVACLAVAALGILLSVLFLRKAPKAPLMTVIGKSGTVTERLDLACGCGQLCIEGEYWAARPIREGDVYERGETVTVVAIEGVKLICKKA